jgi:hypothetical protein
MYYRQSPTAAIEECTKYDLIASDSQIIMIGSGGLLLLVSQPSCSLSFSFIGGVGKKSKELNLNVRTIFLEGKLPSTPSECCSKVCTQLNNDLREKFGAIFCLT